MVCSLRTAIVFGCRDLDESGEEWRSGNEARLMTEVADDLKLVDLLPPRVVIYLSLLSSDASTLSRMCSLLSDFKTVRYILLLTVTFF